MPVEVACPHCTKRLKAPSKFRGRKVKCPHCERSFRVDHEESAFASKERKKGSKTMWYVQTDEGEHFGPVPRNELDEWVAEGRIDEKCQLLRGDWDQWQWADTEYPELGESEATSGVSVATKVSAKTPASTVQSDSAPSITPSVTPSVSAAPPTPPAPKESSSATAGGQYSAEQRQSMMQTAPWVGLISRLGMAASGLMAVGVVFLAFLGVSTSNAGLLFMCIVYLAGGFFFTFVPSWMLYTYFRAIRQFLHDKSTKSFTIALMAQQRFWHYMGVTYIVGFCLGLVFGAMTLFMREALMRMLIP